VRGVVATPRPVTPIRQLPDSGTGGTAATAGKLVAMLLFVTAGAALFTFAIALRKRTE
jgi:hypothetical protein